MLNLQKETPMQTRNLETQKQKPSDWADLVLVWLFLLFSLWIFLR